MSSKALDLVQPRQANHGALTALEPRDVGEALQMAKILFESGLLPTSVKNPQAAFLIMMKGRELGLTAMKSFGSINVIGGKCECSAELLLGLVKSSGVCKYFRLIESTDQIATYETERHGEGMTRLSFTYAQAMALGLTSKDNYKKQPATMLRWRCVSALAKAVYGDVTLGLYTYGEMTAGEDLGPGESLVSDVQVVTVTSKPTTEKKKPPSVVVDDTEAKLEEMNARIAGFQTSINNAATVEELSALSKSITKEPKMVCDHLRRLYAERLAALKAAKVADREPGEDDE